MTDDSTPETLPAVRHEALPLQRMLLPDPQADAIRLVCLSGGEWERGRWLMLHPPTQEQKQRLQARHQAIVASLAQHNQREIAAAVADVIGCYRNFIRADEDPKKVVAKYIKELHGIPTWACVRACAAIRDADAPGISLQYPFSTMQLRALAKTYIATLETELRELSQIVLGKPLPLPVSPETQARVRRGLQRLAFQLKSTNQTQRLGGSSHGGNGTSSQSAPKMESGEGKP